MRFTTQIVSETGESAVSAVLFRTQPGVALFGGALVKKAARNQPAQEGTR